MTLDERHAGGTIDVSKGDALIVRLKENSATGYRWAIENAQGLQLEHDGNDAGGAPGARGLRELRFRAIQPGDFELRLKNWRDWEGDQSIIDRFIVHVTVR